VGEACDLDMPNQNHQKTYTKTYRGAPQGHPGGSNGVPGPSGCGTRDPVSALPNGTWEADGDHFNGT
jgi:hypothetical protein